MHSSITPNDFYLKDQHNQLSIIDVRENFEYQIGHIPGAINLPLSQFINLYKTLDSNTPHYIICQSGARSAQAASFLAEKGFQVTNVLGGMASWKGEIVS